MDKRRASTLASAKLLNPLVRTAARLGLPLPTLVLLETTGRRSGQPRRVPVGKAIQGDTLWVVAEHGLRSGYVRNIQADPRVRVRAGRRWRTGTAHVLEDDDWRERQRRMPNRLNSAVVRAMGTEHVTVRVDLDPASGAPR
ncbi:MAG TPA: nitroreductase/quinone reductase family protein [Thermoleophilaceae bacterium]|nr:nitroreductase/quinone reductase family protein [Thermoleophilaceae bacterium]